jgi:UDP-N-acetylmuramoyl-L-alanyl-D-glutamate--2,6-diaminopimelate ligase
MIKFNDDLEKIINNSANLKAAKGRMDKVAKLSNGAEIYIDFAHNPDSLEKTLFNAKKSAKARLLVLFGCGGDRDAGKRAIMGGIATKIANYTIITDDNPRTEDAAKVRKQIIAGCVNKNFIEVDDRKSAIKKAISMLATNDILIIAGKGHEQYQIIGNKKFPFNEEEIVKSFLK